ncbi:hypothetical protein [Massilia scottii]|uniref:hypothetical protein n=1 Tax=Massilia scottii TaxID=3057166 RepID=UPI0027968569|nr:hypothetical protein [Massilia sp. CCM 9029]MDQ1835540.1 hypothetical protein [Massilia sp. CCM 9029]
MCETKHESVTSLIEERIKADVERSEKEALEPLRRAIEVELNKLGINPTFTSMHTFVSEMRCRHIKNQMRVRVEALVARVVDRDGQARA